MVRAQTVDSPPTSISKASCPQKGVKTETPDPLMPPQCLTGTSLFASVRSGLSSEFGLSPYRTPGPLVLLARVPCQLSVEDKRDARAKSANRKKGRKRLEQESPPRSNCLGGPVRGSRRSLVMTCRPPLIFKGRPGPGIASLTRSRCRQGPVPAGSTTAGPAPPASNPGLSLSSRANGFR